MGVGAVVAKLQKLTKISIVLLRIAQHLHICGKSCLFDEYIDDSKCHSSVICFRYEDCRSPAERRLRAENLEEPTSESEIRERQLIERVQGTIWTIIFLVKGFEYQLFV